MWKTQAVVVCTDRVGHSSCDLLGFGAGGLKVPFDSNGLVGVAASWICLVVFGRDLVGAPKGVLRIS